LLPDLETEPSILKQKHESSFVFPPTNAKLMLDHMHELTFGLAIFLGALHALEPGHGQTVMLV